MSTMWRAELNEECWVRDAPIAHGARVVARCGRSVMAFEANSGAVAWVADLGEEIGDGEMFMKCGEMFVTEVTPFGSDSLTTLVGVDGDGAIQWRTDLPIRLLRENTSIRGDSLVLFGRGVSEPASIRTVDAATGALRRVESAPDGTSAFADLDGLRVFANRNPAPGEHPLLVQTGSATSPIEQPGGVWTLRASETTLLTVARSQPASLRDLEVRDLPSGSLRWATQCYRDCAEMDEDVVAFITGSEDEPIPTLCDAATGALRWHGEPLPEPASVALFTRDAVIFAHDLGCSVYARASGELLRETDWQISYGVLIHRGLLYFGDYQAVVCLDSAMT